MRFPGKREFNLSLSPEPAATDPAGALSPARRVRSAFMRFGLWVSVLAFVVIEGDALLDQSEIGHASLSFMLGTACLSAAACIGLFAIITATGLAVSTLFRDELPRPQAEEPQDAAAAASAPASAPPEVSAQPSPPNVSVVQGRFGARRRRQPSRAPPLAGEARFPPRAL
jgi:hypothetical protein